MSLPEFYRVSSPQVLGEVVEGEAIIVNLETGAYYSLRGAGADLWTYVERGASASEMVDGWSRRYAAPREALETAAIRLLCELEGSTHQGPTCRGTVGVGGEEVD